ncbi:MAG: hypothetical protein Q9173_001654 [Seirophora scorigena]
MPYAATRCITQKEVRRARPIVAKARLGVAEAARPHKTVMDTMLQDSLEFVMEGNVYVANHGFLSPCSVEGEDSTLATLMHVKSLLITGDWIRQLVYDWLARDDVFVRPFLSTIIFFAVNMSEVAVQDDACDLL